MFSARTLALLCLLLCGTGFVEAADGKNATSPAQKPTRLLLLGQGPDGHPPATHEYSAGLHIIARLLHNVAGLQIVPVRADEPWKEGPELLDGADGVVIFLSEGAKWLNRDSRRLAAFRELAARRGGLVVLHWGMGTRDAENIQPFVELLGGCHGGPDRKYKILDVKTEIAAPGHPILRGVGPVEVHEEFYYRLKFVQPAEKLTPLLRVPIDGESHTVAWAWERPDGGRSAGFSGLHFHENWRHPEYRRFVAQAVLWSLRLPIPEEGLPVDIAPKDLELDSK